MDMNIPFDDREFRNQIMTHAKTLASRMATEAAERHFAPARDASNWHPHRPPGRGYLQLQLMFEEKLNSETTKATIEGIIEREFDAILLEATRKMMVKKANKAAWLAAQKMDGPKVPSERVDNHPDETYSEDL